MTAPGRRTDPGGPFDPGPAGADTHLVLEDGAGRRSLWPLWRAVPAGWRREFGPAPHAACLDRVRSGPVPS
ncbi:MbtH family NRPS accessory protein [Streptomyces noursei]|uniref:MbtH family NRPS accessory protein n=1 Tax=Streptomyces noursei TaxID=1971 RepID=UPI0035DE79F1